jgi:ribosomal protein L21E
VVVDLLTRYPFFIPVQDVKASTTVQALKATVYPLFGPPDILISDEGAAFRGDAMQEHCKEYGIEQDMVSPGNHKANGLAERYVGMLHEAMTRLSDDQLPNWAAMCEPIAHCLRATPCSDTLVSPAEMLTGRPMKHPYAQPVGVGMVREDMVGRKERQQAYVRARAMLKREQEHSTAPLRAYVRNTQVFKEGDFVRMRVESSVPQNLLGRPRKWTQRWAEKGTVVGPVEGHPDQFWVRRSTTGRVVRRSASTLYKGSGEQDQGTPSEMG